ncbi:MAG: cation diffusion facilitator family transporter [Muribaculaceae bacterium]
MTTNRNQRIVNVTFLGGIVNALLLMAKFAAGVLGHSAAMIADAVHSLSDFVTDVIVIVFVRLSNKPADADHAYGHGKYETIATSIIGMALLIVAALLGWNGLHKIYLFINGEPMQSPGQIALYAALLSIAAKEWVFRVTRNVAQQVESSALEANAWHHRSDALSSVGTAIGIGAAVLLGNDWAVLDPIAAVVVSVFIIKTALMLLRKSAGELLEERLPSDTENLIQQIVYRTPDVKDIHHLYTRRIGNAIAIEMHLRLPGDMPLAEAHARACNIEHDLRAQFGNSTHIMLHLEPIK